MGNAGYESDLWLAYLTFIITSAFSYGPLGSLFFAAVWTGLFMLSSLEFYDAGTHTREQLPMRLTFFVLVSFCMVALSAELRKQREKLEHQSRETLSMLATIVEARDTDAGRHLKRITHYSRALALSLGLSEVRANEIAYAAMIHDVGKAQVPDAILKKPGPLTAEERREIEKHTVWGYDLLSENEEFRAACEVARSHHERWDGTGYPDSVRSEDIPIAARITAVADVYDALTSERPYKHAWSSAQAIAEITRLSGTHFDPQVVAAFLELHQSGILRAIDDGMRAGDTPAPADDLLAA
jgi:HD-GYP domain-containing protein (c-di-GMP phosphodiesterase class II)